MSTEAAPSPAAPAERGALRVSVVVPTWMESRLLPRLLASLAREGAHELVVSDGESHDGTAELAERAGARVVRGPRGRGAQLARGARAAAGELLLFLHADSEVVPGSLAALVRAFEDPALVASGMHQTIVHPSRFYRWVERAADARVRRGWIYGDSGLCVRRTTYEAVGGFRELAVFEDLDLCRRLRGRGRIALVSGAGLTISPRRWEREGRLRRTLKNWALTLCFAAGVEPARLARHYRPEGSGSEPRERVSS